MDENKLKQAFLLIKKDISTIKKHYDNLEKNIQEVVIKNQNEHLAISKKHNSQLITTQKNIGDEIETIKTHIKAISEKVDIYKKESEKGDKEQKELLKKESKQISEIIKSIDKDISTLNENFELLLKEEKSLSTEFKGVEKEFSKVKTRITKQDALIQKVTTLKKDLTKGLETLSLLKKQIPELQKKLTDDLKNNKKEVNEVIQGVDKKLTLKTDSLEKEVLELQNNDKELKETISTVHKQLKETTESLKAFFLTELETKNAEILGLKNGLKEEQEKRKYLEKKITSLEKDTTKAALKKEKSKGESVSPKEKNEKKKSFFYNLFFEDTDEVSHKESPQKK